MRPHFLIRAAPFAAVLALAGPALAVDFDTLPPDGTTGLEAGAPAAVPASTVPAHDATASDTDAPAESEPAFGARVATDRLDGLRGGDGNVTTTTNRADLRGNVGGNTATNVIGRGNLVSDGSFGNAAGISTVIQNSGSNVLIQNSTIVNVQFVPTP